MKYLSSLATIFASIWVVSCNLQDKSVERVISLGKYKRFGYDTARKFIPLTVLNVYPAALTCEGAQKYSNLYITRLLNNQILYVFETCHKVSDYIRDSATFGPQIDTNNIVKINQDSLSTVFVPKSFALPEGAKYIFATLSFVTE